MAASPRLDADPLLQLQEVASSKASERPRSRGLPPPPSAYSPPLGMDGQTVCIPSPYTDSSYEYNHGPLAFYSPSVLSYGRPAASAGPAAFWPSGGHHSMPSMTLRCPQPLVYGEPGPHAPWLEAKAHGLAGSSLISCNKPLGKRCVEGVNSSSCSSSSSSSSSAVGKADMHFCAVCHDYASGYHYGVWSCEGCKAFFKRSIQGHNNYICPATNQCTIDKNRRKSCQACRLRKCYEVGMMKCGVRRERCSYRGARHRRGGLQARDPTERALVRVGLGLAPRAQRHLQLETPLAPLTPLPQANNTHHSSMSSEEFISRIMEAEPPDIYLMEDLKKPFTQASMMMSLTNLADKELVLMISWAKKIPGFVELSLADQIHLLKCCWLEILMLGLIWRSVDHPGKLIFSPDFKLNREEGQCVEGIMVIFDMLLAATSRFRELKLQREEYVCLKAMILLNSNLCTSSPQTAEELESRNKLLRLLDSVIDALVWAISKLGLSTQQQTLRLGHLTMLLSHIRHVRLMASSASCFDFMRISWSKCATSSTHILCHVIVDLLN
ncbi:estrogen receptor 2b isoform X2 [Pseudoliparis swirei]|uniref:estrogen receptor 2b isoform X2 n=1 Tax=Pseudoliparis swirei TaxID=2059687 RepID=UPI0024BE5342|nr:estrogen receptor 2b isoform X2 [Pseudoliparis swirei]XP_056282458.1 estrogen receptor 2b isoform X2 [Pseudoliparis swirei]